MSEPILARKPTENKTQHEDARLCTLADLADAGARFISMPTRSKNPGDLHGTGWQHYHTDRAGAARAARAGRTNAQGVRRD